MTQTVKDKDEILHDHDIAGLGHREVRFGGNDQSERLQLRRSVQLAVGVGVEDGLTVAVGLGVGDGLTVTVGLGVGVGLEPKSFRQTPSPEVPANK